MDITRRPRLMQGGARQGLQVSVCATTTTTTTTTNTKNDGVVRFCEMVDTAGKLGGAWQQQQQDLSLSLPLSLYIYNSLNMFYL